MRGTRSGRSAVLVAGAGLVLLAACTGGVYEATVLPAPTEEQTTTTEGSATAPPECDDALASYPPSAKKGSTVAAIEKRGRLIAGVSSDTWLFGARNPLTGEIEGFDIDRLHAISEAIFDGDPDRIEFRVITTAQRIPVLADGEVDIVARTMTITCERWQSVAFSGVYYEAGQKVLVRSDSAARGIEDLAGQTVCAPRGSTSLRRLEEYPDVTPAPADTHTGCLVRFQQGEVDAITGDDTVLAGLAAQDPYAKVVGEAFSEEPYGLAMSLESPDLVQFVNHVLEQEKSDGAWRSSYQAWLSDALGAAPTPPKGSYGRKVPAS